MSDIQPATLDKVQAAAYLNVPVTWVRDMITQGVLKPARLGKHARFTQEQLDAYIEEQVRRATQRPQPDLPVPTGRKRRVRARPE